MHRLGLIIEQPPEALPPSPPFREEESERLRGQVTCPQPSRREVAYLGFEPGTSLPHSPRCLHTRRDRVTLFSESREETAFPSTNQRALPRPAPHNKQNRTQATGGQAAGPASPSKATGCQVPGSWARWGTQAGYSPRSCCTEPPEMVGSAMCPCSTRSVPSGSFHQLPDRSCAPAVQRMGRQTEKPN